MTFEAGLLKGTENQTVEDRRQADQTRPVYYWLLLAEADLTRRVFAAILRRGSGRWRRRKNWRLAGAKGSEEKMKAFFDETAILTDCVMASSDGTALVPYQGPRSWWDRKSTNWLSMSRWGETSRTFTTGVMRKQASVLARI
jgi:hypothetical protein